MADDCTYDIYFYKFRGRAEPIRLLLEYVGVNIRIINNENIIIINDNIMLYLYV